MSPALTALDLFCGAGGTTAGLRSAGYRVLAGFENDPAAGATYLANHGTTTRLFKDDLSKVDPLQAASSVGVSDSQLDLLAGCPPCQPFSTLGSSNPDDKRDELVDVIHQFAAALHPKALMLENVPGLAAQPQLRRLMKTLEREYVLHEYLLQASDYGVPQSRRRFFVVGIRRDLTAQMPDDLHAAVPRSINLRPRKSGEVFKLVENRTVADDELHRGRNLTELSIRRLRATTPGGGRAELPDELVLDCHRKLGTRNAATTIYGRIDPEAVAPTMTTRCTTPSCGRFGHPSQDRAITLREAALLQTFDDGYRFVGSYGDVERQIGNAVPPHLARSVASVIERVLRKAIGPTDVGLIETQAEPVLGR